MLDATRAVENADFIAQREAGHESRTVAQILKAFCSHTDGCTMSGKKNALVNIGGWLAHGYEKAGNFVVVYEELHTCGGMAGRDMEAMARGIVESLADEHIRARLGQVQCHGHKRMGARVPVVRPIVGHAVYLDARAFDPQLDPGQFPAQSLAADRYVDCGVRARERGIVSTGRDRKSGPHHRPALELVRLTIPRRIYTQAHMDLTAKSVIDVYARRSAARGLKRVYEPRYLRFLQARFERLSTVASAR